MYRIAVLLLTTLVLTGSMLGEAGAECIRASIGERGGGSMRGEHWATVIVAGFGVIGVIVSTIIGYQAGSNAVNKDYVALAISTLDKKDASPELRKWSVDVLSELSPVHFGEKLKKELTVGDIVRQRNVYPNMRIPKVFRGHCPDIVPKDHGISTEQALKVVNQYERCRIASDATFQLIDETNKLSARANLEQVNIDNGLRKEVGLPALLPTASSGPPAPNP